MVLLRTQSSQREPREKTVLRATYMLELHDFVGPTSVPSASSLVRGHFEAIAQSRTQGAIARNCCSRSKTGGNRRNSGKCGNMAKSFREPPETYWRGARATGHRACLSHERRSAVQKSAAKPSVFGRYLPGRFTRNACQSPRLLQVALDDKRPLTVGLQRYRDKQQISAGFNV